MHWFNTKRLLEPIGSIPPAEFEALWLVAADRASLDTVADPQPLLDEHLVELTTK